MDIENDSEHPNSSSTSASNSSNNSSSNLIVNLPMLPMLHGSASGSDNDVADDNNGVREMDSNEDFHIDAASIVPLPRPSNPPSSSLSLSQQPPQSQPPPTTQSSSNNQIAAEIVNDSVFVSPFLYNNNSDTTTSTTPSSSTTTTPPHQEHSTLSSSHQQPPQHHALSSLSSSSSSHLNASEATTGAAVYPQPEELQSAINSAHIADTIDVPIIAPPSSAIQASSSIEEDEDGDVVISTETATSSRLQDQRDQSSPTSRFSSLAFGTTNTVAAVPVELGDNPTPELLPSSPTLPPPTNTPSLPLALQPTDDESKQRQPTYPPYFTYLSSYGGSCSSNSATLNNSNNKFGFGIGNGAGIIGGTVANMFSNNDNNSTGAGGSSSSGGGHCNHQPIDRIKLLYPNVNENETPLPRSWSPHDKCLSIGLSQNNLRVHYKGGSKQHSDAASVRTAHPIPPACGLYYFEVKIISKGKNGYMGIGLTAQQFRMNRLPGWDKQSYGYHGDDGNSFSSSGNGQSYGPTFTTGDIIGCCVNFVNNTCFYTKNGLDLGIAFRDLPTKLYPTVGLQTPGEEVDANFGQEPFKFDQIEDMMKQMRTEMTASIYNFPMPADQGDPTTLLHKMVSSYLVHNGYSQTAEAFARATSQTFREELSSIRNRQKILKLVMNGRMGQAIEHTLRSYPGLLENNKNLWFMLKCRQFVEMVNGCDIEYCPTINNKTTSTISNTNQTTQTTPPNQTSVIQSTKTYQNGKSTAPPTADSNDQNPTSTSQPELRSDNNAAVINPDNQQQIVPTRNFFPSDAQSTSKSNENLPANLDYINDVEMENNGHNSSNGDSYQNGSTSNNFNNSIDLDEEMADADVSPAARKYSHGIERILDFGKELSQMGQLLEKENKMTDEDRQMLEDAFSLIAYSNPWSSPLGWQLCPTKRETVCTALNSAILESLNYPRGPPLDICVGHANELLRTMAQASLGACAFVNVHDIFLQN